MSTTSRGTTKNEIHLHKPTQYRYEFVALQKGQEDVGQLVRAERGVWLHQNGGPAEWAVPTPGK
jgi:hypothetical protein